MKGLCKWVGTGSGPVFYNDRPYKFSQVNGIYSVRSEIGCPWVYNESEFNQKFHIIEEGIIVAKPNKETSSRPSFLYDRPHKFSQVDGIYFIRSESGYSQVYNESEFNQKFHIIEEGITVAKPKKETWKFTVSSDTLINLNEIEKNLTRERPVAIVSYNTEDNYKVATVLIHESIMDKAYTLPSNYSDELQKALNPIHESQLDGTAGFVDIRTNFTRPLMKAIKAVRTAAIPRKRKGHLEVTVDMMEV